MGLGEFIRGYTDGIPIVEKLLAKPPFGILCRGDISPK